MKRVTEEIIARFERQVGAKPCLNLSEWVVTREEDGKRVFDLSKLEGKYGLQMVDPHYRCGTLYYYDSFWDAFMVGLRVFQDSGKYVSVSSMTKPGIRITITAENPDARKNEG